MDDETQTEGTEETTGEETSGASETSGSEGASTEPRTEEVPENGPQGTSSEGGTDSEELPEEGAETETTEGSEEQGVEVEEDGSITEGAPEDKENTGEIVPLPVGVRVIKTTEGASLAVDKKGWVPLSREQWFSLFVQAEGFIDS